ncbi:MAG: beta-N-acetylglucosaminidase domain-containing protein [Opitutaceae bacterium]|nr:beta-N-acetylglucosaminidase domain-containing protein [Opitutaceae bacterium]
MSGFLSGVIEGFYGPPWSAAERGQLLGWMQEWGLDTYLHAPKDDLKHRAIWRECHTAEEAEPLRQLIRACAAHGVRFIPALGPGLDLRYDDPAEIAALEKRFAQLRALGAQDFALLFDDIPERPDAAGLARFGSLAAAQCHVANTIFRAQRARSPGARFLFCPTPYCGRMAERGVGGPGYLATLGRELDPGIDVLWTGPEIISREITVAHVRAIAATLRRKPILWDNLHANDYDGRRFFCGPYAGRPPELRAEIGGVLANPNSELPLNFVPLRTLAEFVRAPAGAAWAPRAAYLAALRAWWPGFATVGAPLAWEDFVRFCDCHYLPHEEGAEAEALFARVATAIDAKPAEAVRAEVARLRDFCGRLVDLRDRALFAALHRRAWELREELDLLDSYLAAPGRSVASDFHLPGTYRGGAVARLQRLLVPQADGTLAPP